MAIEIDRAKATSPQPDLASPSFRIELPGFGASDRPISPRHRMAFTEQLALLLEAGVPLHTALGELGNQADDASVRTIIESLKNEVVEGAPLSVAMGLHPRMFNATYVNLIASGEAGGFLPSALQQLMDLDEKSQRLRGIVVSALTYPVVLLIASFLVVCFVLLWVFPRFAELFQSMGDKLPILTIYLMRLSNLLRDHWIALLALFGALGVFIRHTLGRQELRERLDAWLLKLPVLGPILTHVHLVPTLRVLSLSLANGVPMIKALGAAREVSKSLAFRGMIDKVIDSVSEGQSVSSVLSKSGLLPTLTREMIATGEATGNLAMVLGKLCDHYQRQLEQSLQTVTKLAEPLMLLIMSGVIGTIVSALILPIFQLSSTVGG